LESLKHKFKGTPLKEDILLQIKLGVLKAGDAIMPEKKLAERYKLGYLTVRRVISELEEEKIVKRFQGKGTFIVDDTSSKKKNLSVQVVVSRPSVFRRETNPTCWFINVDILKGVLDCCAENGIQPELIYSDEENLSLDKPAIILNYLSSDDRKKLEKKNTPYVCVNLDVGGDFCRIISDDAHGTYLATAYLVENGYRKIAYMGPDFKSFHCLPRYNGFISGLSEYGLKPAEVIFEKTSRVSDRRGVIANFLRASEVLPEAIVCSSDLMAMGAMEEIKKAGLKIPGDIGIIGFDDIADACFTEPPLTTVAKPRREMGYEAVKFILNWEENMKDRISTRVLKPRLVIRETVKKRG